MSNRKAWLKVIYRLVAQRASGGFCHTSESIKFFVLHRRGRID
jgi:hypothetical protein